MSIFEGVFQIALRAESQENVCLTHKGQGCSRHLTVSQVLTNFLKGVYLSWQNGVLFSNVTSQQESCGFDTLGQWGHFSQSLYVIV